jgi:hypothetical protein
VFEHVTILLAFVYALAVTHLLSTATDAIVARDRVKASGLLVMWMFIAGINVVINWIGFWSLSAIKHWTIVQVVLQLMIAFTQYFTCSLVSMKVPEDGAVDMRAFYERQRGPILASFAALCGVAMIWNYAERDIPGLAPGIWLAENAFCLGILVLLAVAALAKPRWAQYSAAALIAAASVIDLGIFAMAP